MNNSLRQKYLDAIGIQNWQLKTTLDENDVSENEEFEKEQPQVEEKLSGQFININQGSQSAPQILTPSIDKRINSDLAQSILSCQKCTSRSKRLNALVGQGSNASIFVISDAPNAEEDRSGQYMTGFAQSLFHTMLKTIGLNDDFFLTGIIKCHSMEHYLNSDSDLDNCAEHLYAQLEQINPAVVVVLGVAPAQAILQTSQSFNKLRGKIHTVTLNQNDYRVIVTYHPAYLLRNPLFKKEAMADLIRIKTAINEYS